MAQVKVIFFTDKGPDFISKNPGLYYDCAAFIPHSYRCSEF